MCRYECVESTCCPALVPRDPSVLLRSSKWGTLAPSGREFADHAGARRVLAPLVISACARFLAVPSVGLGPANLRGAIKVGGPPGSDFEP
jgi:hypothetical protein